MIIDDWELPMKSELNRGTSDEELDAICKFYGCKHYDLDSIMVDTYRQSLTIKS